MSHPLQDFQVEAAKRAGQNAAICYVRFLMAIRDALAATAVAKRNGAEIDFQFPDTIPATVDDGKAEELIRSLVAGGLIDWTNAARPFGPEIVDDKRFQEMLDQAGVGPFAAARDDTKPT